MTNSNSRPSWVDEILAPYIFDAEGNPRTIEHTDGNLYSWQEAERLGLLED